MIIENSVRQTARYAALFLLIGASILGAFFLLGATAVHADASSTFGPDAYGTTWKPLRIGAGGWLVGMDIAPDGTKVVRTDTYGAYLWNGSQWQQLVTTTSMPSSFINVGKNNGVMEIRIAPSNTNIFYMMYLGYMFKSTNRGVTWTQLPGFAKVPDTANDYSYRFEGQKMAIDPVNPNIVYAGTETNGLFVTTDGGITWSKVSAIPIGTGAGMTGIAFDTSSGTTGGATNKIYVAVWGKGALVSNNGGASWTQTSGGPTNIENATVANGIYYAAGNSSLWSYSGGVWTKMYTDQNGQGTHAIAVDPANPQHIVGDGESGILSVSNDGGKTWSGWIWNVTRTATDIPWLAWTQEVFMSSGNIMFDPTAPNKLYFAEGIGVWYTSNTSNSTVNWTSQSLGIEQLVADDIISPPGGNVIVASWDRPLFTITNPDVFPLKHGPNNSNAIVIDMSVDWASSNPSFIVADMAGQSSYSTDAGATWTKFASIPSSAGEPGSIAAASPNAIVWAPATGGMYVSKNSGSSWTAVSGPSNSGWAYWINRQVIAADRVNIGTFYAYMGGNIWRSTDGGSNWTNVQSNFQTVVGGYNVKLRSVPGQAGNLFFTGGQQDPDSINSPANESFLRSTDGGSTWTVVPNVLEVKDFGFGKAAPGATYPAIYIDGWVNKSYGIWESDDNAQTWRQIGLWPTNSIDDVTSISGDMNRYGRVYVGFHGSGYVYGDTSAGVTTPPPGDTQAPTAPTNLVASSSASSQINLTWSASSDNVGVTGYRVYRNGSLVTTVTGAFYSDAGLTPATQYSYTVSAFDAAGNNSAQSGSVNATTQSLPQQPSVTLSASPSVIVAGQSSTLSWSATNATSCSASGFTASGISGSVSVNPTQTTTYSIVCNGMAGSGNASTTVTVNQVSNSGLTIGGRVVSTARLGVRVSPSINSARVGVVSLGSVGTVIAGPTTATGYTWWQINWDNNLKGWSVQDYLASTSTIPSRPTVAMSSSPNAIKPGESSTLSWTSSNATSCTGTNFTASGVSGSVMVTPSQTTAYTITCSGVGGTGTSGTTVRVIGSTDTIAPATPANLKASAVSATQIKLSWSAATDNVAVTGYTVYRDGTLIATSSVATYTDSGLTASSTYSYSVAAYDAAGNTSAQSARASATTLSGVTQQPTTASLSASPTSITAGQSATLTWSSTNATSCTGINFTASSTSGSVSMSPTGNTTYSITCTGTGGTSAPATVTVAVSNQVTPPAGSATFTSTASPAIQNKGWATTPVTFPDVAIGTPSPSRIVVVGIFGALPPSVSIGGIPATLAANTPVETGSFNTSSIWYATVPAGTSATISLGSSVYFEVGIQVGVLTGAMPMPASTGLKNFSYYTQPISVSATVPTGGVGIMFAHNGIPTSGIGPIPSWTGATGDSYTNDITNGAQIIIAHTYSTGAVSPSFISSNSASYNYSGTAITMVTWAPASASPTATLSADPSSITSGQSATLTWSSTNATSCTGTNFTASGTSGSVSVSPSVNTTYSITCTGTGGTSPSSNATVTVTAPSGSGGEGTAAPVTFTQTASPDFQNKAWATTPVTFSNVTIGTPSSSRVVVVGVYGQLPPSVTINGISATLATSTVLASGSFSAASIWYATVPTNTSATVVLGSKAYNEVGIQVGTLTGVVPTPVASGIKNFDYYTQPISVSATVPTGGVGVVFVEQGINASGTAQVPSWTGAIGDGYTNDQAHSSQMIMAHTYTAGSDTASLTSGNASSYNFSGTGMVMVSWAPALSASTMKSSQVAAAAGSSATLSSLQQLLLQILNQLSKL